MKAPQRIVGIDLGTTHTVVAHAAADGGEVEILPLPQLVSAGEIDRLPLLPSFLYAPLETETPPDPWDDAPWIVGTYARRRGSEVPARLVASSKSWLSHAAVDRRAPILPYGTSDSADVPRLSPVDAARRILSHVRHAYDAAFPGAPLAEQMVVLTVPASFDQTARELTVRAAHEAGLGVRLLEEPQAAFYDYLRRRGGAALLSDLGSPDGDGGVVLVCDIGGGTTDLTLIRVARSPDGGIELSRTAVGRHLLLGGDNIDLALAHRAERDLVEPPARLEPSRFAELVLACRAAKEALLSDEAPEEAQVRLLGRGSALVGNALSTRLGRDEVTRLVLDGFFPAVRPDERPRATRTGLVGFGLPYEHDPAITRHIAAFLARHALGQAAPDAVLYNGGIFHAATVTGRLDETLSGWAGRPVCQLATPDPDRAVARGAVTYGLAVLGRGLRIGGGSARGYYIGLDSRDRATRAVCVIPRGSLEGERHLAQLPGLELVVGQPVRFDLFASDKAVHAPGEIAAIDDSTFEPLAPLSTTFETESSQAAASSATLAVKLEGELSPTGTLDLCCVEADPPASAAPKRFSLAFDLRARDATESGRRPSRAPASDSPGKRLDDARDLIDRVFGKGRHDVSPKEAKNLVRELERLLKERSSWSVEVNRALFDALVPMAPARKRSPDHERAFWMLAGFCLRPGYGHPLDERRAGQMARLFDEAIHHKDEARVWAQFWIAWRRIAGGLHDKRQTSIRDAVDPFLATDGQKRKKKKNLRPHALDEMLAMASSLERVPRERRAELGDWILERTWTERDPRLWAALGRLGARVPTYASAHHVVAPRAVERWLDHLLREKWETVPTAPRAAVQMARMTTDRARDVSEGLRRRVVERLEAVGADAEAIRAVREHVPLADSDRTEFFGESLPVGLRLGEPE